MSDGSKRDGAGIGLFGDRTFQVGPLGQLKMPRREGEDDALQGRADRRRCKLALVVQWGTSDQFTIGSGAA